MVRITSACLFSTFLALLSAISAPAGAQVPAEQLVSFGNGAITLNGWLWKPNGSGPFPAVVWNHGSEQLPGSLPEVAPTFVNAGFLRSASPRSWAVCGGGTVHPRSAQRRTVHDCAQPAAGRFALRPPHRPAGGSQRPGRAAVRRCQSHWQHGLLVRRHTDDLRDRRHHHREHFQHSRDHPGRSGLGRSACGSRSLSGGNRLFGRGTELGGRQRAAVGHARRGRPEHRSGVLPPGAERLQPPAEQRSLGRHDGAGQTQANAHRARPSPARWPSFLYSRAALVAACTALALSSRRNRASAMRSRAVASRSMPSLRRAASSASSADASASRDWPVRSRTRAQRLSASATNAELRARRSQRTRRPESRCASGAGCSARPGAADG